MKIEYIKPGVRITSRILNPWESFMERLRQNMESSLDQVEVIDKETLLYFSATTSSRYTMTHTGHKKIHVDFQDHISDVDYSIEFQKLGDEVLFVFTGCEDHFMGTVEMLSLFQGLTWNKRVIRETIDFVMYE